MQPTNTYGEIGELAAWPFSGPAYHVMLYHAMAKWPKGTRVLLGIMYVRPLHT